MGAPGTAESSDRDLIETAQRGAEGAFAAFEQLVGRYRDRVYRLALGMTKSETEAEETDFWLELPYARWKEMLENIKENGQADLHHTLNTIDLEEPEGFARSHDGYRRDAFYRFNQTFQYFFDASARVDTTFV